ncbi:Nuclear pore complex protein NUP88 [Linum grandiflorum]
MRFKLDIDDDVHSPDSSSRRTPTPKEDVQWIPLQKHPVFTSSSSASSDGAPTDVLAPRNLLAWDGASRLYYWDSREKCLHRVSIKLGEPEPASVLAASPSKVLLADVQIDFVVNKISINRNGSAMILAGSDGICLMYLYGRSSASDNAIICRTLPVGSQLYSDESNTIRTLQVSWHPYSETHIGVLSSDSVFRIFNLSSDFLQPEQEYYLQPLQPGGSRNAACMSAVDFSFGGDHLWDRFSVFVLFSDGSIYLLCPVVPFGSVYKWDSVLEIYNDASTLGLESSNPIAVGNSSRAVSWLEATFLELTSGEADNENIAAVKAHAHVLFDSSICLQGPLQRIQRNKDDEDFAVSSRASQGRAVGFLYNLVSKDSVLVTAWSSGQLQIDALADEIQPVWTAGSAPRLRVNSHGQVLGLAMICESIAHELPVMTLDQPLDHTVWLGHPPPLLRLAIVDLSLPQGRESGCHIVMFADPLMPEKIYCLHEGGVDSILLHFLPFTNQSSGKDETARAPSVHPVLSTCQADGATVSPLCGFVPLSDSFGYSWIVGITAAQECVILEMKTWNFILPVQIDKDNAKNEELKEMNAPDIISKELLAGPKAVPVPQVSPNFRSVSADSIEGRSMLHQYFKLFHENYVEYAHKVYFELKHHGPQLKRIITDQQARLKEAHEKLLKVKEKQTGLKDRMEHAVHQHNLLEQRLQHLRNLPGVHKKPLSRAERKFKSELDQLTGVELDAFHTSIETLRARQRRYAVRASRDSISNQQRKIAGRSHVLDSQISQLKSSLAKLSLVNAENSKKVKIVESGLKAQERGVQGR